MRLVLSFPQPWDIKEAPGNRFLAVLPGIDKPQAIVTFGSIVLRPDEPRPFLEQLARSDVPVGTKVQLGPMATFETSAGWPGRLIESEVLTANGELVESRLCACFTFMEHAAVAMVRTGERAWLVNQRPALLRILASGRPDWRGEPLALADLWDLTPPPSLAPATPPAMPPSQSLQSRSELAQVLAQIDVALAEQPTAENYLRRGSVLLDMELPDAALAAFRAALALSADSARAHYLAGVALGTQGRHAEAVSEWEEALKLDAGLVDARYNLAQARFNLQEFQAALTTWQTIGELNPADFMARRKVIQCLYALARFEEGEAARAGLREWLMTTQDPRARLVTEYVYDQFAGSSFHVYALETLRPADAGAYTLLSFRAVDGADKPLPATVLVETSEQAKLAGTPFVLGLVAGAHFKVIGAAKRLPPYAELKKSVLKLLEETLQKN